MRKVNVKRINRLNRTKITDYLTKIPDNEKIFLFFA